MSNVRLQEDDHQVGGTVAGLFAGIGGLELGLAEHGLEAALLCEIDPAAQAVLAHRFPGVPRVTDIRSMAQLPEVDVVTAGFPCQDLSQAGTVAGIGGSRSGLVDEVFRLLAREPRPRWVLLENVPFMLRLDRGRAMRHLTASLNHLGYTWAYRIVDARAFGLPQRRQRVLVLASRTDDPRAVLFADDVGERPEDSYSTDAAGFYWTEGTRGLGWAVDATPTLKGGSSIGIASPPAVRLTGLGQVLTPGITDAERLQGFFPEWTVAAEGVRGVRRAFRWKLVGNAVSVRVSSWIGSRLTSPGNYSGLGETAIRKGEPWPVAAWGRMGVARRVAVSAWPAQAVYEHLNGFLTDAQPLSERATAGFLKRALASKLRFVDGFLDDVRQHLESVRKAMPPGR